MGERAKIILNEYYAKSLLMRDTLDLNKFYTADLKLLINVARKEIERLQEFNKRLKKLLEMYTFANTLLVSTKDKAIKYINETTYSDITGIETHSIKEFWFINELLEILGGSDK